jgi:hypothetical protein
MATPQISIADLYSMKNKKDKIKTNTFNVIIEKIHSKIKHIAQQGGMEVFYEIPYVLLGYPLYNIIECIDYVVDSLRKNGLLVQILPHPNNTTIYISWKPIDVPSGGTSIKQLTSSNYNTFSTQPQHKSSSSHIMTPFGIRPKRIL